MPGCFVGRAAEVAALRDLCRQVVLGRVSAVAVVVGDPGSGKTRLLAEFQSLVDVREQISICGYELEQNVPLACARGLLERLKGAPGGEALEELAFGSRPGAPVEQVRLFEAAYRALGALSPVLVLVDDLHWADDASLALLHYLIRAAHADHRAVALVAGARRSARATGVLDSYGRTLGTDRVRYVELGPLDREDGIRLARQLDPDLDQERAEAMWRTAEGSPFWLEVLASGEQPEPSIATMVARRLAPVGADAASVMALLAIRARPLLAEDIADIQRWPVARVEDAASALEHCGLVVQDGGSLWVAHDLIRHAALQTIPSARIRRIHGRIGVWLSTAAGDNVQLLLAAIEHLHRSGASVVALAVRLAGSPRRTLVGVSGLQRLAAIVDEAPPGDRQTVELRARVASLASELGQHDEALRHWSECASVGDPVVAARAALRASDAAMALGLGHEAWRQWQRARAQCDRDAALAVETQAHEAELQWYLEHRPTESRAAAEAALAAGRGLAARSGGVDTLAAPVRRALLRALGAATDGALSIGDVVAMLAFADERATLAAGVDERTQIRALVDGAMALRLQGRNVDAEARLRPLWDLVRRQVLPQATLQVGAIFGNVLLSSGRLEESAAVSDECVTLGARLVEFGPARALTVALPHLIELTRGEWRRAIEGLRESAAAEPDPHYRLHAHKERAAALAYLDPHGAGEEVRDAVAAALADADQARCDRCLAETAARGAEALARIGDAAAARSLLDRTDVHPTDAYNRLCLRRAQAALAVITGDEETAVAAVESVIAEAERQGLHLEALRTRVDLGSLLVRHDRRRAVETVRTAGAIAEQLGARTEQRLAEQLLRSLGMRTWRRGVAVDREDRLSTLTGREREIARMVSEGATNPEIAAAVFLSRKTVERHVSNILAKLGLRNRAELAALASDLGADTPTS